MDKDSESSDFLLYQRQGMLIFGAKQGLDFLVRSQKILRNGTFKTAPPLSLQIYTIFGSAHTWKVPAVWGFLTGKTEKIYKLFFKILSKICNEKSAFP